MEILQLVDQLEQVLNRGRRLPLSSSLVVNEEECMRLIDQMRISVPSAIKESERMVAERDRILAEAHAQGEATIAQAEQEVREMVSQHYLVEQAQREAERIVVKGRNDAGQMIDEAEEYVLSVLHTLTNQLNRALQESQNGIDAIESTRKPMIQQPDIGPVSPSTASGSPQGYDSSETVTGRQPAAEPAMDDETMDAAMNDETMYNETEMSPELEAELDTEIDSPTNTADSISSADSASGDEQKK